MQSPGMRPFLLLGKLLRVLDTRGTERLHFTGQPAITSQDQTDAGKVRRSGNGLFDSTLSQPSTSATLPPLLLHSNNTGAPWGGKGMVVGVKGQEIR